MRHVRILRYLAGFLQSVAGCCLVADRFWETDMSAIAGMTIHPPRFLMKKRSLFYRGVPTLPRCGRWGVLRGKGDTRLLVDTFQQAVQ